MIANPSQVMKLVEVIETNKTINMRVDHLISVIMPVIIMGTLPSSLGKLVITVVYLVNCTHGYKLAIARSPWRTKFVLGEKKM